MKRHHLFVLALVASLALLVTGCSKSKAQQQGQLAELEARLKQAESANKELVSQAEQAALKAADEKRQLEDAIRGYEARLMLSPLDAFKIEPAAHAENGWLLMDGERTLTLLGYEKAVNVRFYWADTMAGQPKPELLGAARATAQGWSWTGVIPYGYMKSVWAEVEYPGGVQVVSPILPVRSPGK